MKRTALGASLALAMGFAAPAFAQEIGGVVVSPEDWPYVEEYCDILADESVSEAADETPSSPAELSTPSIELSSLTQADCEEAGLIEGNAVSPGATLDPNGPMANQIADEDFDDGDDDDNS